MPLAAAKEGEEVVWGHPRPRQGDGVPLHPLLILVAKEGEEVVWGHPLLKSLKMRTKQVP